MKRTAGIAVAIGIVIFVSFFALTNLYIGQYVNLEEVVVASEPIPPRTEIEPSMLTTTRVTQSQIPENAAPSIEAVLQESRFTGNIGLNQGETVTLENVFIADEVGDGETLTIDDDKSIIAVSTDLVRSAGASIHTGTRIRALAYKENPDSVAFVDIVADNLKVMDVVDSDGRSLEHPDAPGGIVPAAVKLAVTPENEQRLIKHEEKYRIYFAVLPENYKPIEDIEERYDTDEIEISETTDDKEQENTSEEQPQRTEESNIRQFNIN